MAGTNRNPDQLIDEVISYIKRERELFGDFAINQTADNEHEDSESDHTSPSSSTAPEPSLQNKGKTSAPDPNTDSFSSQEGLFNQEDSKEVYYQIEKCSTLQELEELCRQADVLRTDLAGTKMVFGVGNPNADLMLVGEAPGAEEDKQGKPFVGRAGKLLNEILEAIDFEREDVYIGNILKHRPPNNRNPKPKEREQSLPFLLRQIDLINPKLILALGKVSAQTLLNKNLSLTKMRGQFHSFRGKYELLATYHPAALLRHSKWKRPTWEDVQLLRKRYDELGGQP